MQVVVAAALVVDGKVLAARRTHPAEVAGKWELPGGKVKPGESDEQALVREIAEELGCPIEVTGWLPQPVPLNVGMELRVGWCRLLDGMPTVTEHDQLRWVSRAELSEVDWLPADAAVLPTLARGLGSA